MKNTNEVQQEIIQEFALFTDWLDKYEYIIDFGKNAEKLPENLKRNEFLIEGCQSNLWLVPEFNNGRIHFMVDSDAIITRGIASLLLRVFDNRTTSEILDTDLFFIKDIGLSNNLSPNRANGLAAIIEKIYGYAKSAQKSHITY